ANVNASTPLGYLLDDSLQVNGALTLNPQDVVEIVRGKITVSNGALSASNALVSSIKQGAANLPAGFGAVNLPTCGSVFAPLASGVCPNPAPGDWGGLVLDGQRLNTLTGATIRFAGTGIEVDKPANQPLSLAQTNVQQVADTAIHSESYLVINSGQLSNTARSTGNGIWFDSGASISGTQISNTGQEGIVGTSLDTAASPVVISGTSINGAGTYGIRLMPAGQALAGSGLTITNNDVSNSGTGASPYPAIYLGGVSAGVVLYPGEVAAPASAVSIQGNTGKGNGLDALAFHGSVARNVTWLTANQNQLGQRLGYLLDGDLDLNGYMLAVNAGDIVKVGNGGTINLDGGRLQADDTSSSSQKIFTTLADNSAGVAACPSVFLAAGCSAATSYWGGITLPVGVASLQSDGTLVNAAVRYARTGINISSGATATFASSVYGLVVAGSTIGPVQVDGIKATATAVSVTNSTVNGSGGLHGITADLTAAPLGTPLRFSGNRFMSTGAEAIVGQALAGQPVWITDNQVQQAGTFGIRLLTPDELVLRNNNVSGSGKGAGGPYPAIYLSGMTGDFASNIRGNVGSNNALDAIAMHGTVQMDASVNRVMQWISPFNSGATHQLGYVLDGGLTLQNSDFKVNPKAVVKVLSGSITINQGTLTSGDKTSTDQAVFTSFKDNTVGPSLCPSIFISPCAPTPAAGDWGGLKINGLNPTSAQSLVAKTTITYANTALAIDAGPFGVNDPAAVNNFRLEVSGSTITDASGDAINSVDTPIRVDTTVIGRTPTPVGVNIGGRGIIASFLGAANCSGSSCERFQLTNNTITRTGKDGIVANGLAGQPVDVEGNHVVHATTYGIRLLGANLLTLTQNSVVSSGLANSANPNYPAILLNGVKADFETAPGTGSIVQGNHGNSNGLDALAFDGEATKNLSWLTPAASAIDAPFGYLLDGSLTVDGTLTTKKSDVVKILNGGIKINPLNGVGGVLDVPDATTFTSLKDPDNGMAVCNSVLVTDACPSAAGTGDWNGINIDAGPSTFKNGHLLYATSGITINGARLDLNGALLTKLNGYAVHTTGTGYAVISCSSIHDNGGGILSEGAANATSIDSSDIYGNTSSGHDVVATVATRATNDWWGVDPPAASQYNSNAGNYVTFAPSLPQQGPTLLHGTGKITVSSENTKTAAPASTANPYLGYGTLTVKLTFDRGMDTTQALTVNFAGSDNVVHSVTGTWVSNTSWTGIATVDGSNHAGDNRVTVSGGKSCAPDGTRGMAPETSNTTDTPFYLDFGTASVAGTGGATSITPTAATLNDSVNPNGWSDSSSNPNTDTYVFFQTRLDSATSYAFDPLTTIVPGFDPTHLLGYQKIGHGSTAVNVRTTVGSLAAGPAGTTYDYRTVAVDLNGVRVGTDQLFTTAAQTTLDHFSFDAIPGQTAGTAFTVTVTAYDATNTVIAGYTGASAVLTSNLSTAPTGSCAGSPAPTCQPSIGALTWVAGTGTANVTAYVAEANRTFTLTDGGVHANSASFAVGNTGTAYQLGFSSTPQILAVNALSRTMTVQLQDRYSNPFDTTSPTGTMVNLAVAPLTAGSFLDSSGTTAITTVNMPLGSHAVRFTYKGTAAGPAVLTASAAGVNDGSQTETVANQLVVKTAPQTGLTVGTASGAITIQLEDASGNPVVAGSDVIATLVLPTTDPNGHFRDSTNTANISQVTISSGSSSGTFLYKPAASGSQTITVHVGGGIPDAQQTESVS
ncbi:MAG TPA: right-handed parallel beta-helix repeat-containing protein, partial [Candidatus Dormibacteraeota bacterium]|nr:right-handed parallel beta-helix repeat-containing protein [Candidatus Dormibacteraeota bacterium]